MQIKKVLIILTGIIQIGFASILPILSGKTLTNTKVTIPNQIDPMVLILGFDMKSASLMADWVSHLNLTSTSNINWYQVAVIGRVPPFVDGFIKKGMKTSVNKAYHNNYLPYFGGQKKELIKTLVGSDKLENLVTPFIVIATKRGELKYALQAELSTKDIQIIQNKLTLLKESNTGEID